MFGSLLTDIGAQAVAFAAIVAAAGFLSRLRPIRWVFLTLIAQPMSGWFRREIRAATQDQADLTDDRLNAIEHEFAADGGYSLRDRVNLIEDKVNVLMRRSAP